MRLTPKCWGKLKILPVCPQPNLELADFEPFLSPAPGYLLPASEPAPLSHCPDSSGVVTGPFCASLKGRWQESSTAPNLLGSASKRAGRHFATLLSRSLQADQQQDESTRVPLAQLQEGRSTGESSRGRITQHFGDD